MPTADEFRKELRAQIDRATRQGRPHAEINAGELHRTVGGYPPKSGETHAMPNCCRVMREELERVGGETVHKTDSGDGAALTIRYRASR